MKRMFIASAAALAIATTAAFAAVTFDPATGTGFVGKGDVQLVFGWNNKALQDNAGSVEFRVNSVSASSWTCSKPHPQHGYDIVQQRSTTTTLAGVVSAVSRENSKGKDGPVTGFLLLGYDGNVQSQTEGPAVGSCPADQSGFEFDEDSLTTTNSGSGGLEVKFSGSGWVPLQ